ncbi:MAG: hypothetical protein R3C71_09340 [Candidatus Krumholzibacteriia bacterium]|nr:hypothetical protein [bacterium]MCB9514313.1 hypothetical protein [Candidatus Latescibacterota bacterium]MCB9516749.1 hypothetical protein [Candidatus Latescibacterota bacterium]
MRRHTSRALLLGLVLTLAAAAPPARAASDDAPPPTQDRLAPDGAEHLEADLLRLRERLAEPGGPLFRYERSLRLLGESLDRGEYRQFYPWLQDEIVRPWRQIRAQEILQLADLPPTHLNMEQRHLLLEQGLALRRIETQLRHARRLLTRLGRQDEERRRRHEELGQLVLRYQRRVQELQGVAPERAAVYREWYDGVLAPQVDTLEARDLKLAEPAERMLRWTEDPALREMLGRLRRVNRAMEMLRHRFDF